MYMRTIMNQARDTSVAYRAKAVKETTVINYVKLLKVSKDL